jgi:hypothetical protein
MGSEMPTIFLVIWTVAFLLAVAAFIGYCVILLLISWAAPVYRTLRKIRK